MPHVSGHERRRRMVALVEREGPVSVHDLSQQFGVSAVTVRSDLERLADDGLLVRSHGGALPVSQPPIADMPLAIKQGLHAAEKLRIAQAAVELIEDGDTVILDSGTTTAEIARQIRRLRWESLTVVTNALNIAFELTGPAQIQVVMLGGILRPMSYSMVGQDAEATLSRLTVDRLFLGADGVDAAIGLTTPDPQEAHLNACMIEAARERVALVDGSKFGRRSLSVIAPVQSVQRILTDQDAPAEHVESVRALGVRVDLV